MSADAMRLQLAPMRVVEPPAKPLPLPVLVSLIEERVSAVKDGVASIGCLTELLEQALPHLQLLNRLESSSVL